MARSRPLALLLALLCAAPGSAAGGARDSERPSASPSPSLGFALFGPGVPSLAAMSAAARAVPAAEPQAQDAIRTMELRPADVEEARRNQEAAAAAAEIESGLARELAGPSLGETGSAYDSRAREALLELPETRTASEGAGRSVLSITAGGGRFLINGKAAERLRPARREDGLLRELLVHPDDPGLLVKLYHSAASLAGWERHSAKLASLERFSEAGAAPAVLERGETPVPGLGRVQYYVQERVTGVKLESLPPQARASEHTAALFSRLAEAGLALAVPGPDASWLLRRVMLGETRGGGARAYLLGGATRRLEASALGEYYKLLQSTLQGQAPAPARPGKLRALDAGLLEVLLAAAPGRTIDELLAAHKARARVVASSKSDALLRFRDARELAQAVAGWLAQDDVALLAVHPSVKDALDRDAFLRRGELNGIEAAPGAAGGDRLAALAQPKSEGQMVIVLQSGQLVEEFLQRENPRGWLDQSSPHAIVLKADSAKGAAHYAGHLLTVRGVAEVRLHPAALALARKQGPAAGAAAAAPLAEGSGLGKLRAAKQDSKPGLIEVRAAAAADQGALRRRYGLSESLQAELANAPAAAEAAFNLLRDRDVRTVSVHADVKRELEQTYEARLARVTEALSAVVDKGDVTTRFVTLRPGIFFIAGHKVTLTQPVEMSATLVTQEQFFDVMGHNPSHFKKEMSGSRHFKVKHGEPMNARHPVETVTRAQAQEYCDRLNALQTDYHYRLPTDAEWAYAAHAGANSGFPYWFGHDAAELSKYGWHKGNSGKKTHEVGLLEPNPWGLYDMYGNVREWVGDAWRELPSSGESVDPFASASYGSGTVRGGSFEGDAALQRSDQRLAGNLAGKDQQTGFRVVRVPRR